MFEKSDKTLPLLRLTIGILLIVLSVLYLVLGIVACVNGAALNGVLYIFAALALPVVGWVILSFTLACAADVKIIRNKLYGESNAPIAEYFTAAYKEGENAPLNANDNLGPMLENLKKMKELLDGGVLTKEEFDALKKKYLGDI